MPGPSSATLLAERLARGDSDALQEPSRDLREAARLLPRLRRRYGPEYAQALARRLYDGGQRTVGAETILTECLRDIAYDKRTHNAVLAWCLFAVVVPASAPKRALDLAVGSRHVTSLREFAAISAHTLTVLLAAADHKLTREMVRRHVPRPEPRDVEAYATVLARYAQQYHPHGEQLGDILLAFEQDIVQRVGHLPGWPQLVMYAQRGNVKIRLAAMVVAELGTPQLIDFLHAGVGETLQEIAAVARKV